MNAAQKEAINRAKARIGGTSYLTNEDDDEDKKNYNAEQLEILNRASKSSSL